MAVLARKSSNVSSLQYPVIFIVTLLTLFTFTVSAPLIPRSLVKQNMTESADYMVEQGTAHMSLDFYHGSFLDYYADSITLSIAYHLDEDHPVSSSMWANYYGVSTNVMPEYLQESVRNNLETNMEYMRYWHGSASLMRILHVLWNVKQIFLFHSILIAGLLAALLFFLWRNNLKAEAVCYMISVIAVNVWFVPLCLEYTYTILIMLIASIIALKMSPEKKTHLIGPFFLITGMVTVYFDFLTAETLTLLIPLLLILRIRSKNGSQQWTTDYLLVLKSGVLWAIGYIGMWISKWVLAALILRQNMLPFIGEHIAERLDGDVVPGMRPEHYIIEAIQRNLKCLFPYEFGISGAVLVFFLIVLLILPVFLNKVRIKKEISKGIILLFGILALLPFLRFAVLHNHAYRHYVFTHRALAATVLAICFIVLELVERVPEGRTVDV